MRRIKDSLSAKVFLGMFCALTLCSLVVYGIVMLVIPNQYTSLMNNRTSQLIDALSDELSGMNYDQACAAVYDFCLKNHTAAVLTSGSRSTVIGEVEESESNYTSTIIIDLADAAADSMVSITTSLSTAAEISDTFLRMLPLVALMIFLISAASAWLCSRSIVRPVLSISGIARRMADMDMTWHCNVTRTDELGILSDSLNALSDNLKGALGELEAANAQLKRDYALVRSMEKQRRDFFAAASHELKTPITILKGQIESMIYGIGKYKNVRQVLPETLSEIDRMEGLVKEILSISRMELEGLSENRETLAVDALLHSVLTELAPVAEQRRIQWIRKIEPAQISGNARLFRKALHNILSNALLHSPEGATVEVRLDKSSLVVQNSGVSLPEEELDMLFRPFHRVEKSRNRATGGSGLGLYIVKTISDLHGLGYDLRNTAGGVAFTLRLQPES